MSKQYNKAEKRKRRQLYIKRKKRAGKTASQAKPAAKVEVAGSPEQQVPA